MSGECQVNVKSQSELDIGGRETCFLICLKLSKTLPRLFERVKGKEQVSRPPISSSDRDLTFT